MFVALGFSWSFQIQSKGKTMYFFIWTLSLSPDITLSTSETWMVGPVLTQFATLTVTIIHTTSGAGDVFWCYFISLIDPTTCKLHWHKHYSEINCYWFVNVKACPRFAGPQTTINKHNFFTKYQVFSYMLLESSEIIQKFSIHLNF